MAKPTPLAMTDALYDVAEAIWNAGLKDMTSPRYKPPRWSAVYDEVCAGKSADMRDQVYLTIKQARAAVNSLRMSATGKDGNQAAAGMGLAGEHVSGLDPQVVAETFDAVLDYVVRH